MYCSNCSNLIAIDFFNTRFLNNPIALDTSAIISRIVSKDLKSSGYLKGKKILIPSFVYDEIESKRPSLKKGGQSEIESLSNNSEITTEDVDTYLLAHGLENDRKIVSVLLTKNAVLLSNDKLMISYAGLNHFVIYGGN
jgi:rRNA-processing protein FCF1